MFEMHIKAKGGEHKGATVTEVQHVGNGVAREVLRLDGGEAALLDVRCGGRDLHGVHRGGLQRRRMFTLRHT